MDRDHTAGRLLRHGKKCLSQQPVECRSRERKQWLPRVQQPYRLQDDISGNGHRLRAELIDRVVRRVMEDVVVAVVVSR